MNTGLGNNHKRFALMCFILTDSYGIIYERYLLGREIMEIDTKTTIIFVLLGVIFGMIGRLQGWF